MKVDDIKITMEIPVRFNWPDKNGYVYTKESWEEAVKNAVNTSIEIIHDDDTWTVVGAAQDVQLVNDGDMDIVKVSGMLRYGGTSEEGKYTKDVIINVTLNSIGITK